MAAHPTRPSPSSPPARAAASSWGRHQGRPAIGGRRAGFICETLAGNPDYPGHLAWADDDAVALLARYNTLLGHTLVAPRAHREQVTGDFRIEEYLGLQRLVYQVGEALRLELPTERLYVMSLGSQSGNRHVHWHVAPLPPGVPYDQQQFAAFSWERGVLDLPDGELAALAGRIGARVERMRQDG